MQPILPPVARLRVSLPCITPILSFFSHAQDILTIKVDVIWNTATRCSLNRPRKGGYLVTCPALPGLVTEGDTYEEAHDRAVKAIEGYLESLQSDGLPFPVGRNP